MPSDVIRFGPFELNIGAYTLCRDGRAVHVERLPMDLLILLAQESERMVSRAEIVERLWGQTFIDVDNAINTAVRKVRRTLGERPEHPRYLVTVVGKGYRLNTCASTGPDPEGAEADGRVMLIVLPFENLSGGTDQEYFSDGLTEETIACLGQVSQAGLGVIARTTSMAYKHTDKTVARIGAEIGVDYVLEGSVRRSHDQVRITAQLIRVRDQSHVWAESYDRRIDRILEIQAEMGAAIADQVRLQLIVAADRRPVPGAPIRPGAYDDYLRGLYHQARLTRPELDKAIVCFRRAIQRDPEHAAAYTGLAHCFIRLSIACDVSAHDAFPVARTAIEQALLRAPDSAEALTADAATKFWFEWDFAGARHAAERAVHLNRNHAPASLCLAHVCSNVGEHAAALAEIRRALVLDPLSLLVNAMYGQFLYQAGEDADALEQFESTLELEPHFWIAHICKAKVLERLGRYREALDSCNDALAYSGGNSEALSLAGYVYAVSGDRIEAERKIGELQERSGSAYVPPYNVALIQAGLCDVDACLHWLGRAFRERDVHMTFLRDHKWDRMRRVPKFRELADRVGFGV